MATQTGTTTVNAMTILVAMPLSLPTSKKAPCFTSLHMWQYLETVKHLRRAARYSKNQLLPLILRYASNRVRRTLAREEAIFNGNDWEAVKKRVIYYYGLASMNRCSPVKLRHFSELSREKKITSRKQVDRYHRRFCEKAGTLVANKKITQAEYDYLFYKGFHKKLHLCMRTRLVSVLAAQGKQLLASTPLSMMETLDAARAQFDLDDINFSTDDNFTSDNSDSEDSSDSSSGGESSEDEGSTRK